jgi:hypothetical protein
VRVTVWRREARDGTLQAIDRSAELWIMEVNPGTSSVGL